MLGKVFFVVLSCSLLLNPRNHPGEIIPAQEKGEVFLTVPQMANSFAMMELLVNPKKSVLKLTITFAFISASKTKNEPQVNRKSYMLT